MKIEPSYYYTTDHEWLFIDVGVATIGVTFFAQDRLGDIVYVDIPKKSGNIQKGEPIASVESVKAVADVYAPIEGKIVETNESLGENPQWINDDPYHKGWIVKLKPTKEKEIGELMDSNAYKEYIKGLS